MVGIDNYDFASGLKKNIAAASNEDAALRMDWKDSIFSYGGSDAKIKKGRKLINELTEYYVLDLMSTHLTDFFNINRIDKSQLVELERNDIADILLSNRILELFSKPMEHRVAFKDDRNVLDEKLPPNVISSKVIASYSNGAIFQHFDFVLPKGSKISKDKNGFIVIITDRFELKYKTSFHNSGALVPLGYKKYFLKLDSADLNYHAYEVSVELNFTIKPHSLIRKNNWDYYRWVDDLIEKIEDKVSKKRYFRKIDWDKAYVIIKSNESS